MSLLPGPLPAPIPTTAPPERPAALFVGNALWLDFVNTRYIVRNRPVDVLVSFAALVEWLAESAALSADDARAAIARWDGTAEGADLLKEALALRDALRDLADLFATGTQAPQASDRAGGRDAGAPAAIAVAVAAINGILRANVSYDELTPVPDQTGPVVRYARHARLTGSAPLRLLAPLADSASELLCGGDPSRVHRCGNPKCVLYFYDTTRNRRRLFCSPAGCGNRVKAAARYRRSRESGRTKVADQGGTRAE